VIAGLYMDQNVPIAITQGLRERGIDVLTAFEDGSHELSDPDLLDRATALERVLFTQDADFLTEAAERQRSGRAFAGVIYIHQRAIQTGEGIADLDLLTKAAEPDEFRDRVTFLPLR